MVKVYRIEDLDCAHCAAKIEAAISALPGVVSASVSFLAQKMTIESEGDIEALEKEIVKICKKIEPDCTVVI